MLAAVMLTTGLVGCIGALEEDQEALEHTQASPRLPGHGIDESLLTEPIYDILPQQVDRVTSTLDGIELYAEIYLPDGEGPWPTILQMSPYYGMRANGGGDVPEAIAEAGDLSFTTRLVEDYVPRGYAVVLAHVRGTGNSQGCMDMMGAQERQDAHDTVAWIAEQPWSDGKVGMEGVSYVGTTPHEALVAAPEHLVTVVTTAGVTNQWRNTFMNGVPYDGRHYPLSYNAFAVLPPTSLDRGPAWAVNAATGFCEQEEAVGSMTPGTYEKGLYTQYWAQRNMTQWTGNATASILYNQGFDDRAVNPSEAVYWFNDLDVPKKAFLHQAGHQYPPRADYFTVEHAWLDHWLKGIENGVMDAPTVEVLTGADQIRTDTQWPPTNTSLTTFHLAPGELTNQAPGEDQETYLADMARNAATFEPTTGTEVDATLTSPAAALGLPSQLTYLSQPLEQDLYVAGEPRMHLVASVDAENTYFLFDLYELDPESGERDWIGEGWFNAHLRDGYETSAPLTPGEETTFRFRFEPADQPIQAGHQLELVLRGHDTGVFPIDELVTQNTIHYGEGLSALTLPVLEEPQLFERPEDV